MKEKMHNQKEEYERIDKEGEYEKIDKEGEYEISKTPISKRTTSKTKKENKTTKNSLK